MPPEREYRIHQVELRLRSLFSARLRSENVTEGEITVHLRLKAFPRALRLGLDELGGILHELGERHRGLIRVGELNNGSTRVRAHFFPVTISEQAFPEVTVTKNSFRVVDNGEYWGIRLTGSDTVHRVGRKGSLKGELFRILGSLSRGATLSVDVLLERLGGRVTDLRTQNPRYQAIENALREINETVHAAVQRRFTRTGERGLNIGIILEKRPLMSWYLDITRYGGVPRVGFKKRENMPHIHFH